MLNNKQIGGLFKRFSAIATCMAGKKVPVYTDDSRSELGYSTPEGCIYLCHKSKVMDEMSDAERVMMLRGVFSHELLHILITKFPEYFASVNAHKKNEVEYEIYKDLLNICEDGAIEFFAPNYLSEEYVKSLEFVRASLYKSSEKIDPDATPFSQYMRAVMHFRFFGFVKGDFSSGEAKRVFTNTVPLFAKCWEEPKQASRIDYANRILEESRPLWVHEAESAEAFKQMMDMLRKLMSDYNVSENSGNSMGSDGSSPPEGESPLSRRRRITVKRVSAEEYKKIVEESEDGNGGDLPDGDITIVVPDEPVESPKREEGESSEPLSAAGQNGEADPPKDGAGEPEESDDEITEPTEDGKPSAKTEPTESGEPSAGSKPEEDGKPSTDEQVEGGELSEGTEPSDARSESTASAPESRDSVSERGSDASPGNTNPLSRSTAPEPSEAPDRAGETDEADDTESFDKEMRETLFVSEDEIEAINNMMAEIESESEEPSNSAVHADETNLDLPVSDGYMGICKNVKVKNITVKCSKTQKIADTYEAEVAKMAQGINLLTSQLKRIIRNRQEESAYKQSGKVSAKRLNCGRRTSRVFTKRRSPETSDLAVVLAVDMSGSMSGQNIAVARQVSIALAEIFGNLRIPLYIFGFSADEDYCDAAHFHFINWSNRKENRYALLSMGARANNFDGYAIRYGAELLKHTDADKKLLIVLSDGAPACNAYGSTSFGIQDVKQAVSEANRAATTIGILLGSINPEEHRVMYGYNFLHCRNVNDLFTEFGKILKKYI